MKAGTAIGPLGDVELAALGLLVRLPLLWTEGLVRLLGRVSRTTGFELVAGLRRAGLVGAADVQVRPGRTPLLLYPTDRGVAALAGARGAHPAAFAGRAGLRAADLRALVPGLPHRLACYELLLELAATHAGPPELVAWECPWRRAVPRLRSDTSALISMPAAAAIRWPDVHGAYLLLPDAGAVPLRAHREALVGLALRAQAGRATPPLVVGAPDSGRAAGWEELRRQVREDTGATPELIVAAPGALPIVGHAARCRAMTRPGPTQLRLPAPGPVGRAVGDPFRVTGPALLASDRLGRLALALAPCDRRLLEVIGPHPYLPVRRLAAVLDWSVRWTHARRDHLIRLGLVRLLGPRRVAGRRTPELAELTLDGAAIVAAQLGLTLGQAARFLGLVACRPLRTSRRGRKKRGLRGQLLTHLRHTIAADAVFVHLHRVARRRAAAGADDALLEWRNAPACARGHVRPDGYGLYRRAGRLYGFLLEYDGGTEGPGQLRRKFERYYGYRDEPGPRGQPPAFTRDFAAFPTVLVVAKDYRAERRVARVLAGMALGRRNALPVLLTTRARIRDQHDGALGPIWREASCLRRRTWLLTDLADSQARKSTAGGIA